jgi:hypothetical protein
MSTIAEPACPHCHGNELRARGWQRPRGTRHRVELDTLYNQGAKRRVVCLNCGHYSHLPAGQSISAHEGHPKVSYERCPCGSTNLRPAGWLPDGRQKAECNACAKEFALPIGMVVVGKLLDTMGRRIHYTSEHEWQLPDPRTEAQAMLTWCQRTYGPYAPTRLAQVRMEISVSKQDREFLEALVRAGELGRYEVHRAIAFREKVLVEFTRLVGAKVVGGRINRTVGSRSEGVVVRAAGWRGKADHLAEGVDDSGSAHHITESAEVVGGRINRTIGSRPEGLVGCVAGDKGIANPSPEGFHVIEVLLGNFQ